MYRLEESHITTIKVKAWIWSVWLLSMPLAATAVASDLEEANGITLTAFGWLILVPLGVPIVFVVLLVTRKIETLEPAHQYKRLDRFKAMAASQALISAAMLALILQFETGLAELNVFIGSLLWTAPSLFYFSAHWYQMTIELPPHHRFRIKRSREHGR